MKQSYVYILTNKKRGTLYIGVTSNLLKRVWEHKNHLVDGFSKKYDTTMLVYFEVADEIHSAIEREKQLKKWNRLWKIKLVEMKNPEWNELYDNLTEDGSPTTTSGMTTH